MRAYIVLTGPPAAGKSTYGPLLADRLDLPLLAKDTLKGGLLEVLAAPDVAVSRQLGRAAVRALLAVAAEAGRGVLDSVWVDRAAALDALGALPAPVVEVALQADPAELRRRYAARSPTRGRGHFDAERQEEELWGAGSGEPLAGRWPVVALDTTAAVDVDALVARVRAALRGAGVVE